MIVYKTLSSLASDLGFSARALYSVSNSVDKHYREAKIPKKNGEFRQLHVPDKFLKAIQRSIVNNILIYEPISNYAKAYRYGGSTKANARPHIGQPVVLKLDIRQFFNHITYPLVKEKVFTADKYSEENRILLSILCVYQHTIPQGAPTSPIISNIILRDFDNIIGEWCNLRNISYTRYCDDMTFSGDFDPKPVIEIVSKELKKLGFFLNNKKTTVLHDGQRKTVTGIVVNETTSVPVEYRKKIRQDMHYCMKYGVEFHMERCGINDLPEVYVEKLLGRINYALSIRKNDELIKYRSWLLHERKRLSA